MNASQSPSPQAEAPRASAPRMYTWISETGRVIEQVRIVRKGESSRARGRIVSAAHPDHQAFTLEYQVEIGSDLAPHRVQLTVSTEEYERTIDLVRDAEGSWLLDDPSDIRSRVGGGGVIDVDVTYSVFFASVISRRLGLHSQPGSVEQRVLSVDSLTLDVSEDSVTFSSDDEMVHGITATAATSATVDSDGFIVDVTGLSRRV
ncbi:putative glycolipid-binding domain-containing protein [Dietzia psychralcaliphila]|nr:putative glycolipid-binding domain-containing protein [Dietzia psychralcaliphila]